jgi:hypothetical protein
MYRTRVLSDILEEHFEELLTLWQLRRRSQRSAERGLRCVEALDARIAAHLDGLLSAGAGSLPLLTRGLRGDERPAAFAAAYVLMRLDSDEARRLVAETFGQAKGGQLAGIVEALCRSPIDGIAGELQGLTETAPAAIAAAATEVLLWHGRQDAGVQRLGEFVRHADPAVRLAGWRIAALQEPAAT